MAAANRLKLFPTWDQIPDFAPVPNGNGKSHDPTEAKSAPLGTPTPLLVQAWGADFIPMDDEGRTYDVAGSMQWYRIAWLAYACMGYRATKLAEPPLWIKEEKEGEEVWLEGDHPLAPILKRPNPDQRMRAFLHLSSLYLDATGRCVWLKIRNRGGRTAYLRPFSDDDVLKIEAADGRMYGRFHLVTQDGPRWFNAEDVIHLHDQDPEDAYRVVSPLMVATERLGIDRTLVRSIRASLRNAVVPGLVIGFPPDVVLDKAQKDELRKDIDQKFATAKNHARTFITGGGMEATQMKLGFKGIEGGSLLDEVEAAVCACFQIPPVVIGAHVGLQNSSDRHNLETSVSLVYANAVKPRWAQIEEALTDDLLAEVDPSPLRFVRFVTSRVEALQEDKQAQADIADKVGGALRVDEVRAMLGYQPLGDERGEELFQKSAPAAPPRPMPDEGEEEAKRARAPHRRKAADDAMRLAIHDATLSAQEAGWTIAAAAELDTDRDGVVSLARGAQKDGPPEPAGAEWVAELIRRAVEFIDTESVPRWRAAVQRLVQATGTASAQRLAAEIGISFDLLQPGLLEYTQREAAWLVTQIADTTKQAIRDALAQGLNEGESIPQMTRRLQESGAFSRSRAELIARTETTRVTNGGQRESLSDYVRENGGKATKRWLTARDERVRPEHVALEGEVRGIDDAFSNGLQAPGEPGCRCTLVYALED